MIAMELKSSPFNCPRLLLEVIMLHVCISPGEVWIQIQNSRNERQKIY